MHLVCPGLHVYDDDNFKRLLHFSKESTHIPFSHLYFPILHEGKIGHNFISETQVPS